MFHIAIVTHYLKGTFDKSGLQNQWWRHCDVISQSISKIFCTFGCYTKRHLCAKFEQNRTRNKEVAKNGKWCHCDVISKNSAVIFVCEYFLLIPIDVPSFKLIEGQIKLSWQSKWNFNSSFALCWMEFIIGGMVTTDCYGKQQISK